MAKQAGRLFVLKKNNVTIGGGLEHSLTVNGEPIDCTTKEDDGFVAYLDGTLSGRSIVVTMSGIDSDRELRALALSGDPTSVFLDDITLEYGDGDVLSGDFVMMGFGNTGGNAGGLNFSVTFTSNGSWTYTPGA